MSFIVDTKKYTKMNKKKHYNIGLRSPIGKPICDKCNKEIEWNKVHICKVPENATKRIKEE